MTTSSAVDLRGESGTVIPSPLPTDLEDVQWALQTAASLWRQGDRGGCIRWLRRAGDRASDLGQDHRAMQLYIAATHAATEYLDPPATRIEEDVAVEWEARHTEPDVLDDACLVSIPDAEELDVVLDELHAEERDAEPAYAPRDSGIVVNVRADRATLADAPFPLTKRPAEGEPGSPSARTPDTSTILGVGGTVVRERPSPMPAAAKSDDLPDWMPESRTIGGFHIESRLGQGGAGDVFVAVRADQRDVPKAARFALKVPDYAAILAQGVAEADASRMFREEAGTLLLLPDHANLAHLVCFESAPRPKPYIVMELVVGIACDELIARRKLGVTRVARILDGVLAGLGAMHGVGVGHLDVKPANVVLRDGTVPVLVDFGLAGRRIRSKFLTPAYGAPEVWGVPCGASATAPMADIYSFGCLAYEMFTGAVLFDGEPRIAMAGHVGHDGMPPGVRALAERGYGALAEVLRSCLRANPHDRATAGELRPALAGAAAAFADHGWPI